MHVHKPKLLHNWRELLKEWGIIVLGVLTALFAEQAVQSFEWHQKVEAAIADMDNELTRGNGPQAYARLAMHDCVRVPAGRIARAVERGDRAQSRRPDQIRCGFRSAPGTRLPENPRRRRTFPRTCRTTGCFNIELPTRCCLTCSGSRTRSWPISETSAPCPPLAARLKPPRNWHRSKRSSPSSSTMTRPPGNRVSCSRDWS